MALCEFELDFRSSSLDGVILLCSRLAVDILVSDFPLQAFRDRIRCGDRDHVARSISDIRAPDLSAYFAPLSGEVYRTTIDFAVVSGLAAHPAAPVAHQWE